MSWAAPVNPQSRLSLYERDAADTTRSTEPTVRRASIPTVIAAARAAVTAEPTTAPLAVSRGTASADGLVIVGHKTDPGPAIALDRRVTFYRPQIAPT